MAMTEKVNNNQTANHNARNNTTGYSHWGIPPSMRYELPQPISVEGFFSDVSVVSMRVLLSHRQETAPGPAYMITDHTAVASYSVPTQTHRKEKINTAAQGQTMVTK